MAGRHRSKSWFLTYPQSGELTKERLAEGLRGIAEIEELVIGEEDHRDQEGKHMHVYIRYRSVVEWKAGQDPRKWDIEGRHPHVEVTRSRKKTIEYCLKEDKKPMVEGVDVESLRKKKRSYKDCLEMGLDQLFDEFGPVQFPRAVAGIQLYKLMKQTAAEAEGCRGVWIQGRPGAGKSHLVETKYPDAYRKPQNKWWDGYEGQEVVILEDLDGPYLNHYLKVWADKWRASGEVKGGTVPLMHKMLVVTSNYSIWQIVEMGKRGETIDTILVEALERRFKVIEMMGEEDREGAAEELELVAKEMGVESKRRPE